MPIHILNGSTRDTCLSDWLYTIKLNASAVLYTPLRICLYVCVRACVFMYLMHTIQARRVANGNTWMTWCLVHALPLYFVVLSSYQKTYGNFLLVPFIFFSVSFLTFHIRFATIEYHWQRRWRLLWTSEYTNRHKNNKNLFNAHSAHSFYFCV